MASSLYGRLHEVFKVSKTTISKSRLDPGGGKLQSLAVLPQRSADHVDEDPTVDPKEKKFRKMVECFKRSSESADFRKRSHIFFLVVGRLCAGKKVSMVEEILQYQKKFEEIRSEGFVTRLIMLYGKSGMFDHAQKLFDEMPELKCERTIKSFNALLCAHIDARRFKEADEALREIPEKLGLKPDLVSYNTMIKSYLSRQTPSVNALSVFDEIEKEGLEPDLITFNTLLEVFYKRGPFSEGEKVWGLMQSKNLVPDVRSYNSRLRGLVKNDRIEEAVELISEMCSKGIAPDVHSYNAMIWGYAKDENLEDAMNWFRDMKEKGHEPDRVTYFWLIPLLCKKSDIDITLQVCKEAAKNRKLLRPGILKPVIDGLVKESRVEEAKELVESLKLEKYFRYNDTLFGS